MKKKITIFIAIIVLLIIVKALIINNYKIKDTDKLNKIKNGLLISDLLVVNNEENDDYIEFKNIKVKNIFYDYDCVEDKDTYTCTKDDNTSFSISITTSYLDKFKKYNKSSSKIIKRYNIVDDLSLFGVIKEAKENSMFASISTNKENYILNKYAIDNIEEIKSIDLIEGDYSGLLFHTSSDSRKLYIYKDGKTYLFSFNNLEEFNNTTLSDILNSIEIKSGGKQ